MDFPEATFLSLQMARRNCTYRVFVLRELLTFRLGHELSFPSTQRSTHVSLLPNTFLKGLYQSPIGTHAFRCDADTQEHPNKLVE